MTLSNEDKQWNKIIHTINKIQEQKFMKEPVKDSDFLAEIVINTSIQT